MAASGGGAMIAVLGFDRSQLDELIRETIMNTQEDVEEMKEKLDKIDERLYEIQKNR